MEVALLEPAVEEPHSRQRREAERGEVEPAAAEDDVAELRLGEVDSRPPHLVELDPLEAPADDPRVRPAAARDDDVGQREARGLDPAQVGGREPRLRQPEVGRRPLAQVATQLDPLQPGACERIVAPPQLLERGREIGRAGRLGRVDLHAPTVTTGGTDADERT